MSVCHMWRRTCTYANSMHSAALLPHLCKDDNSQQNAYVLQLLHRPAYHINLPAATHNMVRLPACGRWLAKQHVEDDVISNIMNPVAALGKLPR